VSTEEYNYDESARKNTIMMSLQGRADNYNRAFPNYPPLVTTKRWLYGIWMLGNDYQSKQGYYGEYPPTYLKRIISLFPDEKEVLHLFSGTVQYSTYCTGTTFDIQPDLHPDIVGDAHHLSTYFPRNTFDLILADPPYSQEDAEHYGTPMVNRNQVLKECIPVLKADGFICWLDTVLPMYRKDNLILVGTIGVIRSTNHRFRVVSIFQKVGV